VGWLAQLAHTFVVGPLALLRLRLRSAAWLILYLILCAALLSAVAWALHAHRDDLIERSIAYVAPASWHFAVRHLIDRMFGSQVRAVLVNASVGASLVLVSALLFPLKERVSRAFEADARLTAEPVREFAAPLRALEELALFVVFLTAQMTIFWIGYAPDPGRRHWAVALSYFTLFCYFTFNFVSPLLQRRRMRYLALAKVYAQHPIVLLGFGALFTLPPVVAARVARLHPEWGFAREVALVAGVNVACIAWGTIAGTWVASRLLGDARRTRPPSWALRGVVWIAVVGGFALNAYTFGAVGLSLQRKSQILKCHYEIDPKSFSVTLPNLGDLFHGREVQIGVKFDVTIQNPTPYDVELEKNRIVVVHQQTPVALASLTPVRVPSGARVAQHLDFPIALNSDVLRRGRALLDTRYWRVTLFLEVTPGFELPIYLISAP
jgi:hypothetical protein